MKLIIFTAIIWRHRHLFLLAYMFIRHSNKPRSLSYFSQCQNLPINVYHPIRKQKFRTFEPNAHGHLQDCYVTTWDR